MNHFDLLKRAFYITWRYKPLWLFGFILALCGGSGGGGGGNFNFPGSSGSRGDDFGGFGNLPNMPDIDPNTVIALVVGAIGLIVLLAVLAIVLQVVARTALIGMVRQIKETETITVVEGWRLGWSRGAWRIFLLNLLIDIPVAIFSLLLVVLALSPLLLLLTKETALMVTGIILAVLAVLFVLLILLLVSVIITPLRELAWRRTVLNNQGVINSLRDAFGLIKQRFKDVAVIWLLMIGIGFGWGIVALLVVLPVSLMAAVVVGGIPAGLVYLISRSGIGAMIAGVPLALLSLILVSSVATGFYLIYQSTVWTLTYLQVQEPEHPKEIPPPETPSLISDSQA
jgi:hypothetical protein